MVALWWTWSRAAPWQGPTHREVSRVLRMTVGDSFSQPELKDSDGAKHAVREAIALEALLYTELGAMVGYIYVNHIRLDGTLLLIHVVACAIPLFGMALMLFLRKSYKSAVPAHDRSTTMFLRWTVFLCLIMAACVTYEGWVGRLSGKPHPVCLPIVRAERASTEDGTIYAYATFVPSQSGLVLPDPIVIDVSVSPKGVEESWEIQKMGVYVGMTDNSADITKQADYLPCAETKLHREVGLCVDETKQYTIRVCLRRTNRASSINTEKLLKLLDANGLVKNGIMTVTAYYQERETK